MNMDEPLRVLQIVAKMERNGYESRIMDIYRNMDRSKVQYDFYTHRKEKGDFDDEILSLDGRIYYNNPISPLHFFRYLRELDAFFKAHPYEVVHAHLNAYCAWALFAAKRNGARVRIAHSRNSGFDPGWKTIFKRASKLFVNLPPTHRFACSRNAGIWLFGKRFLEDNNSRVIPNAFNCDSFAFDPEERERVRAELALGEALAVVNVGRLTPQKNHPMLFRVFSEFRKKHSAARLFLFGDGELKDELQTVVQSMELADAVTFMGNRPDVYRYLNGMDVMLFPSHYEGFGTVAIEAQCSGLPVLASDVLPPETKVTELIRYLSLNAPPGDWADAMDALLQASPRKDHTTELKAAGYDIKTNAINMQDFYLASIRECEG